MRIPHTVPTVAFEAFRCSEETKLRPTELYRTLRAEDEDWDAAEVASLKTLSLRVIAANWLARGPYDLETLPSAEDRDHALELLPLDLPLELAVARLPYEHYWKRACEARWKYLDVRSHGGSWLRLYCERHLSEHLERVEPLYFEPSRERELRLLELLGPHVRALQLRQLLPLRQQKLEVSAENDEEESTTQSEIREFEYDHVPMDVILERLPGVEEIAMSMGMIYALDGPEWQDFEFSVEDALRLGRGAGNLRHLAKFSLTRSSLNRPRAAALLRGLAASRSLRELDLSHCKLADEGALAVGGYLGELRLPDQRLHCLRLTNNNVGAEGLAGLVRGLLAGRCGLARLDLRLNPIGDDGGKHLAALLLRLHALEDLNVSGCSLGCEAGMSLAEALASGRLASARLRLDCSNNELGPLVGEAFEIAAQACGRLVDVDARMCGFRRESEFAVGECVNRNRSNLTRRKQQQQPEARRSQAAAAVDDDDEDDDERSETLIIPSEYEIFQRRRPAQNLAPVPSVSLTTISTVISAEEEEGEAEEDEGDDEATDGEEQHRVSP